MRLYKISCLFPRSSSCFSRSYCTTVAAAFAVVVVLLVVLV